MWPQQPASQVLSRCLQKSGFISVTPDAFFTHDAQPEATGNTTGINTRQNGSVAQRLATLFKVQQQMEELHNQELLFKLQG